MGLTTSPRFIDRGGQLMHGLDSRLLTLLDNFTRPQASTASLDSFGHFSTLSSTKLGLRRHYRVHRREAQIQGVSNT